jgi:hypothetical protein
MDSKTGSSKTKAPFISSELLLFQVIYALATLVGVFCVLNSSVTGPRSQLKNELLYASMVFYYPQVVS